MEKAVVLKDVIKLFRLETDNNEYQVALDSVSLEIDKGSLTVIGGANGSGKSVLMNIIAGLMKASDGEVTVSSRPGLVFQDAATQILGDTPRQDVAVGLKNMKMQKDLIPSVVQRSLETVGLLDKMDFPAEFLSGGQKRRLAVAGILAMDKDIVIFDEPYANLDYPGVLEVNSLIKDLKKSGKTILLLTHEMEKCLGMADHFIVLYKGQKVYDGNVEDALKMDLCQWGIRNPLTRYDTVKDLVW